VDIHDVSGGLGEGWGWRSRYNYFPRVGQSEVLILVGATNFLFSVFLQAAPGTHAASYFIDTGAPSRC
jgi:hypothetical protein